MSRPKKLPRSPKSSPKRKAATRTWTARTADKHVLYEKSVQLPHDEVKLITRLFKQDTGRVPLSLREDFCGTALLSRTWVQSRPDRTATGIDIDPDVIAWGRKHNVEPLGDAAPRIELFEADVRAAPKRRHDVVCAYNYSYWVFKTREALRGYFASVKPGLVEGGLFVLDLYGGWDGLKPCHERRPVPGTTVTYEWEQEKVDPINHHVVDHIHYYFRDGTKLHRAFTYDWRFWHLPEITELLREAGFADVRVFWDISEDEDTEVYRVRKAAKENIGSWLAYIVARVKAP